MTLILEQTFPLGRFHATRWNQNPFEDRYGEWPPSPWRLLRALAARWFQYSRETGDDDETARDELLRRLAASPPSYHLPERTWQGQPLRQYQPTEVAWTDASKKAAAYRKPKTTLVVDHYRAVPEGDPIFWFFDLSPDGELSASQRELLDELLDRIRYFGRAESWSRFRIVASVADNQTPNCTLQPSQRHDDTPVLVADPAVPLDITTLLAATDDSLVAGRPIPPGTRWHYAGIPERRHLDARPHDSSRRRFPTNLQVVQFAVGGRVYPPPDRWIKITERFRGQVLRLRAQQVSGNQNARFDDLAPAEREQLQLVSGKDADGRPLPNHRHTYFILWPDEHRQPTRLVCLRNGVPFSEEEVDALLRAAERPYSWEFDNPDWLLRLIPLPFETAAPLGASAGEYVTWTSKTPFVPPGNRHRFRGNGRVRRGELPHEVLRKLIVKHGLPEPQRIDPLDAAGTVVAAPESLSGWSEIGEWVYVHETRVERQSRRAERTRAVRPGYRFRIVFSEPVPGPVCLGHSAHFGLGLFVPAVGLENA